MKVIKIILIILFILLALGVIVNLTAVGKRGIKVETDIQAPPEKVWAVFSDYQAYPDWQSPLIFDKAPEKVGQKIKFYFLDEKGEPGMRIEPVVQELIPGKLLRWKGSLLVPGIFDGAHSFQFEPLPDGGTRLTQSEDFQGVLIPFTRKLIDQTEMRFVEFNDKLKIEAKRTE